MSSSRNSARSAKQYKEIIPQGDRFALADILEDNSRAYDLTGRTVEFVMRHWEGDKVVDREVDTYLDRPNGKVEITLKPSETQLIGEYKCEWVITGNADDPTTVPQDSPFNLYIREDVEGTDSVADALPEDGVVDTLHAEEISGAVANDVLITSLLDGNLGHTSGILEVESVAGVPGDLADRQDPKVHSNAYHSDHYLAYTTTTVTGAYSASDGEIVLADASGGSFTVTLPAASDGVSTIVKKIDGSSNEITIATPNSETIDGGSGSTVSKQYESATIVSDGTNYFFV